MCWEKAVAAERSKELLLQELNHRVRNNLFMLACRLQMRLQSEQAAKDAFSAAIGRVLIIANAHDHLLPKRGESAIDMD
jgi:two-component sensor histidine kinase